MSQSQWDPILYNLYCPISTPRSRIFYMRQQNRCHSLPKTFRVLKSLVIPKEVSPLPYAFPIKTSQCGSEFLISNYECHIVATGEELESTSVVLFQWLAIVGYQQHTAINLTLAEWAMLGRGINYSMPSYIRFELIEWREYIDLILLNATVNLWVSEKGGMSVMGMLGSTTLDSSAPLDLPRSAPLRLSGDGQSLSVDDDIR